MSEGKRKVFVGAKFFPCRVDTCQKGIREQESNQDVIKVVSLVNNAENLPSISRPLIIKFQ